MIPQSIILTITPWGQPPQKLVTAFFFSVFLFRVVLSLVATMSVMAHRWMLGRRSNTKIQLTSNVRTLLLFSLYSVSEAKQEEMDNGHNAQYSFFVLSGTNPSCIFNLFFVLHLCRHLFSPQPPIEKEKQNNEIRHLISEYIWEYPTSSSAPGGWHYLASPHHHLDDWSLMTLARPSLVC